jgi:site-specific DNA-methyltransferase (adenine-specific)
VREGIPGRPRHRQASWRSGTGLIRPLEFENRPLAQIHIPLTTNLHLDVTNDESVDLVYLDPPFNSQAQYNVFFKTPEGVVSEAQAEAFRDTWTWTNDAELGFEEIIRSGSSAVPVIDALRRYLKEADLMAYLVMMTSRLTHLHRVMKPSGTIYLHCDTTASHYLKLILDGIFGSAMLHRQALFVRQMIRFQGCRF